MSDPDRLNVWHEHEELNSPTWRRSGDKSGAVL